MMEEFMSATNKKIVDDPDEDKYDSLQETVVGLTAEELKNRRKKKAVLKDCYKIITEFTETKQKKYFLHWCWSELKKKCKSFKKNKPEQKNLQSKSEIQ
jgi:hypothetical protein